MPCASTCWQELGSGDKQVVVQLGKAIVYWLSYVLFQDFRYLERRVHIPCGVQEQHIGGIFS